uniref:Uncharacterized protein n=1 Tax=Callorhinchus milii TaxID=7868 RepID=A0A4W3GYJ3_CALMI
MAFKKKPLETLPLRPEPEERTQDERSTKQLYPNFRSWPYTCSLNHIYPNFRPTPKASYFR